jgi:hypothetical protein
VLQSEPEHERREGACKLHSRQHQHEQGERWLCLNCLQRYARALYKHKRRPQGPAGYLRKETVEEYRRLPIRARREEERGGDEAGPGPAAGDAPVGEDEGGMEALGEEESFPALTLSAERENGTRGSFMVLTVVLRRNLRGDAAR